MLTNRGWILTLLVLGLAAALGACSDDRAAPAKIGFVWIQDEAGVGPYHKGWVESLQELGYVHGSNVTLLTRHAEGDESRLPGLIEELLALKVDVLVVSSRAIRAAQKATATVPIICATMNDPVSEGLVASLAQPGGNLTGVSWQAPDTAPKRLELTMELRPKLTRLGVLFDSNDVVAQREAEIVAVEAGKARISVVTIDIHDLADVQAAFASMKNNPPHAVHLVQTSITTGLREQIGTLAMQARVPLISAERTMAEAGAVLTYGPKLLPVLKRGAVYVDRILKGAKPQDLPIEQPTEFELVVNTKAAKLVGIEVPRTLKNRADFLI